MADPGPDLKGTVKPFLALQLFAMVVGSMGAACGVWQLAAAMALILLGTIAVNLDLIEERGRRG